MTLVYLSCAWLAGILSGSWLDLPRATIFTGLLPLLLLIFTRRYWKTVLLVSLSMVAFLGGAVRFQSSLPVVNDAYLQYHNGSSVTVRGWIDRDPEPGDKVVRIHFAAREIKLGDEWREVSGSALLFVPGYPEYSYGDVLLLEGNLESPAQAVDSEYAGYLAHQEIYSLVSYPEVTILERDRGLKSLQLIYQLRNRLSRTIAEVLPEPQAALVQGITLGIRGNIPAEVRADFARSGTAHLLAISGLHLGIVAGIMLSLGIWLFGRRGYRYIWLALGITWLYALLTGMNPPVLRAAIMASLFLSADLVGRQRNAVSSLLLAAAIMVGISPHILWTASFQMSFAAMAGLIFIFPRLQSPARNLTGKLSGENRFGTTALNFVADSFSTTIGVLITVGPLIAYYFGTVSWVTLPANLFAMFALPGIIISGILSGSLFFILPLARIVGWLAWLFTSYLLLVVKIFAAVSPIQVESISPDLLWGYYAGLGLIIWLSGNKIPGKLTAVTARIKSGLDKSLDHAAGQNRRWFIPSLLVIATLTTSIAISIPDGKTRVSILDVGQGDAILIQQGRQQILVDGGPGSQALTLALGKQMPFWDRTIDLVILTHPHADHLSGLVEVLNRYEVEQVLDPGLDYESPLYDEWLGLIDEKGIETVIAQAGQRIKMGEMTIEVLNPEALLLAGTNSDIDNNAVVLRISAGEISFLLTGDIQREAEIELIARRAELTGTVLKVAHHGSATSTTAEFLAVVNPQAAVIPVGKDNSFGHPSAGVIGRLEEQVGENIYRTDEQGTIEFITDGARLWVKTER